jgi:peptide deformylase
MLKLRFIGDDILRNLADDVTEFDPDLSRIANEMEELMHDNDGIGLAAPQVGISKRLLLVDISPIEENHPVNVFVNPVILESSGESTVEEGCLSIPGVREDVTRPEVVLVKYQTLSGEEKTESFDGWMSRVLQHEIDHLNGILFIDYLSPIKQKLILNSLSQ